MPSVRGALKGRGCVGQVELRHAGVQADQHGVRAEFDRIRYKIAAHGMYSTACSQLLSELLLCRR